MRIVFFETSEEEKAYFTKELPGHELAFYADPLNAMTQDKAKDAEVVCIFVASCVDRSIMDSIANLKAVVTRSTGTDHVDVKAAEEKKVKVLNVPHYGTNTVAEHAITLMLALARHIVLSVERTRKGNYNNKDLIGFDLNGKTLGIIGFGNIGGRVAELAQAFHMKVLVFSRTPKEIPGITWVTLEELLKQSDIITLHAPLTPETTHILNKDNMHLIKKGALIINTARGGLIETDALVHALEDKTIAAAALDVLEEEAVVKDETQFVCHNPLNMSMERIKLLLMDHVLRDFENVIITPHNAFNSREAIAEINEISLNNVKSVIS